MRRPGKEGQDLREAAYPTLAQTTPPNHKSDKIHAHADKSRKVANSDIGLGSEELRRKHSSTAVCEGFPIHKSIRAINIKRGEIARTHRFGALLPKIRRQVLDLI